MAFNNNGVLQGFCENQECEPESIITVVGVGGAGGNAVSYMYERGIYGVEFMVCNTDRQDLAKSPVPTKIQLGDGLGAGGRPESGRDKAMESVDDIRAFLEKSNTKMLFLTAGMGGGTGTGASPVIAKVAREMGILIVGIVSLSSRSEGSDKYELGKEGIKEFQKCVDTIIIIRNENILENYGDLSYQEAYAKADEVLFNSAKGIAEIITVKSAIRNIDFADVSNVIRSSGRAHMSIVRYKLGESADQVVTKALTSPLLDQNSVVGAQYILLNFSIAQKSSFPAKEPDQILLELQEAARQVGDSRFAQAKSKIGICYSDDLENDEVERVMVATGFGELDDDEEEKLFYRKSTYAKHSSRSSSGARANNVVAQIDGDGCEVVTLGDPERRYANIDDILAEPCYITRKVKFKSATIKTQKVTPSMRRDRAAQVCREVQQGESVEKQSQPIAQELFATEEEKPTNE